MQQYKVGDVVKLKRFDKVISIADKTGEPDIFAIRGVTIRPEMYVLFDKVHTVQEAYSNNLYQIGDCILPGEVIEGEAAHDIVPAVFNIIDSCPQTPVIKIKYFTDKIEKLRYIDGKSDWIDLRAAEDVELKAGDFKLIPLGVGMKLPEDYEAHIVPRSSTFKNFGILQTNSMGIIDNSYSGDNDQWKLPALAMRDTVIRTNDRICQFRIMRKQPEFAFEEVKHLDEVSRGGFGSTGKQ